MLKLNRLPDHRCRPGARNHIAAFGGKVRILKQLRNRTEATRRSIQWCCWLLAAGSLLAPQAHAGFVGTYALGNFSLVNTNADGSAITTDGGLSVLLTGGNNGGGFPGSTDLTITAAGTGFVHFQFSFFTLDFVDFDVAAFLINGVPTHLAGSAGDSNTGTGDFAVTAGQTFGFRVNTIDNVGEPGILAISDFSAPEGVIIPDPDPTVPEPATWTFGFAAIAVFGFARRRLNATRPAREQKL